MSPPDTGPPCRAAVVGVAGTSLNADERDLLGARQSWGFILFKRNCETRDQVRRLVAEMRDASSQPDAPVLIDQEGGRVLRLQPPHWPARPSAAVIGAVAERDLEAGLEAAFLHARLIAADLSELGITINCAPVLDLKLPGQTQAIGDRAFSASPELVSKLGQSTIDGYLAGGILPVIKHLPGHGRAEVDSHLEMPVVEASKAMLADTDWVPFRACAGAPLAIPAHVLFTALDRDQPASMSATVIDQVIRGEIGFAGALLSDDLSMGALGGSLGDRAARCRAAGCDIAVHCNGDMAEMVEVLDAAGPLEGAAVERTTQALDQLKPSQPFDREAGQRRFDQLLDGVAAASSGVGMA